MKRELSKKEIEFFRENVSESIMPLLHFTDSNSIEYKKHLFIGEENGELYCVWLMTNNDNIIQLPDGDSCKVCNIPFDWPFPSVKVSHGAICNNVLDKGKNAEKFR
jgi:hypothetical protein